MVAANYLANYLAVFYLAFHSVLRREHHWASQKESYLSSRTEPHWAYSNCRYYRYKEYRTVLYLANYLANYLAVLYLMAIDSVFRREPHWESRTEPYWA